MNIKEIKEILQLMAEHGLCEVELEKEGMKIKLKKSQGGKMMPEEEAASGPRLIPPYSGEAGRPAVSEAATVANASEVLIKSPMVGTFYSAPAPDQPPYVTAGMRVKEGQVLCIVEAMKLMNEIKAEAGGTIVEALVKNGQPVEFDQPLFKLRKE